MNRTPFLDCKHKHRMKTGAPPDKFGVLYRMVTYRIPCFTSRINSKGVPGKNGPLTDPRTSDPY